MIKTSFSAPIPSFFYSTCVRNFVRCICHVGKSRSYNGFFGYLYFHVRNRSNRSKKYGNGYIFLLCKNLWNGRSVCWRFIGNSILPLTHYIFYKQLNSESFLLLYSLSAIGFWEHHRSNYIFIGWCMGTYAFPDIRHLWCSLRHFDNDFHAGDKRTKAFTDHRRGVKHTRVISHFLTLWLVRFK